MKTAYFAAALLVLMAVSQPANACRIRVPTNLHDVSYANLVVIGRVENYRVVRDEALRREMLSRLAPDSSLRSLYSDPNGGLLTDYARFDIVVEQVLKGTAPRRLAVTWDASTFGEPDSLPAGPLLIALRQPSSAAPPLRGPSATILANPEPNLPTVLHPACAGAFIFEVEGEEANMVRAILASPENSEPLPAFSVSPSPAPPAASETPPATLPANPPR